MPVSPDYLAHVTDLFERQAATLGPVEIKRMFGGVGVFRDGLMFALVADETLYFKVDDGNRPAFEAAGMGPFTYEGKGRPMQMSYFECPPDAFEDEEAFAGWARGARDAALAAQARKPKRRKRPGTDG